MDVDRNCCMGGSVEAGSNGKAAAFSAVGPPAAEIGIVLPRSAVTMNVVRPIGLGCFMSQGYGDCIVNIIISDASRSIPA